MRIEQDQDHETKRDRVRRLLLGPLEGIGFRFPKAVEPEEGASASTGWRMSWPT